MSKLRRLAEGMDCTLRLPGCISGGVNQTTVLAHVRRANIAGAGQKPPDLCGVYACLKCHSAIDGRELIPGLTKLELDQSILFALLRTLVIVSKELKL